MSKNRQLGCVLMCVYFKDSRYLFKVKDGPTKKKKQCEKLRHRIMLNSWFMRGMPNIKPFQQAHKIRRDTKALKNERGRDILNFPPINTKTKKRNRTRVMLLWNRSILMFYKMFLDSRKLAFEGKNRENTVGFKGNLWAVYNIINRTIQKDTKWFESAKWDKSIAFLVYFCTHRTTNIQ